MHSFSLVSLKSHLRFPLLIVAVALVVAGCATRRPVPVEDRAVPGREPPRASAQARTPSTSAVEAPPVPTYTVKRGDTLHQIALDSGLDYRELAAWNNIDNANRIFPGQVLRLAAPGAPAPIVQADANAGATTSGVTTAPLRTPPAIGEGNAPNPAAAPGAAPSAVAVAPPPATIAPPGGVVLKTSPKAIK
jgi:lipoprotein NlpD